METLAREADFGTLIPYPLVNLAIIDIEQHRFEKARARISEAIGRKRALEDRRGTANALGVLAQLEIRTGALDAARAPLGEALSMVRAIGDRRESCFLLEVVVERNLQVGLEREGALLLGGVAALEKTACPVLPSDRALIEQMEQSSRSALGETAYSRLRAHGAVSSWDQLLDIGARCLDDPTP